MADFIFDTTVSGVPSTYDMLFSSEAYSGPEVNFNFIDGEYTPGFDFEFGAVTYEQKHLVLRFTTNNVKTIWADDDASLSKGRMYISTSDALSIVNLTTNKVVDHYTQTSGGHAEEPLNSNDIVDINAVG